MRRPVATQIDTERCVGCGSCVAVCPRQTLSLIDGKAQVTGRESLQCDHCAAVCPQGAIRVQGLAHPQTEILRAAGEPTLPEPMAARDLVALMRMRRSCRNFKADPLDRALLDELVQVGASAPSGTNSQRWSFSLLPDRQAVLALGAAVADFFRLVDRLASSRLVRLASRAVRGDPLGVYQREYRESVSEALRDWDERQRDRLFHGAPAVILIGMRPGASCPSEDASLVAGQILLAAESLGLGSCLVGFAVEALRRDPRIKRRIGLSRQERVYSVIALGHPAVRFLRPAGRLPVPVRILPG